MKILVVDDQVNLARVTAVALRVLGCHPFTVNSTAEATRLLREEKIDALFLDVNLGGESGFDFLAEMQAAQHRQPVIMFTAQTEDEVGQEALRRGALGCLTKPFTLDDLRVQLDKIKRHRSATSES